MRSIKIVLIGAGSGSFGRGAVVDVLSSRELRQFDVELVLVDLDKAALKRMLRFGEMVKKKLNSRVAIVAIKERKKALLGADYVVTAVARKRKELWEQEFYIPAAYGYPQVFGENGGPGAAFHTLRSLHLMIPIAKDMEKLCPQALLINYTNPESRVCLAVKKLTSIRAVGLCHGAFGTLRAISQVLGKKEETIDITIGGINHFHWVLRIKDKRTGKELYSQFHRNMQRARSRFEPLTYMLYERFGLLPFPSDSHLGEFVSYGHAVCGPLWSRLRRVGKILAEEERKRFGVRLTAVEEIESIVVGKKRLTKALCQPSGELAVPIICDIELDRNRKELSVNIPNEDLAISNLPEDAIVEIPARVDRDGIHPIPVGALPEAVASLCRTQIAIQNLLVQAYEEKSKARLLEALAIDPVVTSCAQLEQMTEEILELEADFLPPLK